MAQDISLERTSPATGRETQAAPAYAGNIERFVSGRLIGWAYDPARPATPINLRIYEGADLVAEVEASIDREDLRLAGKGDGRHGFEIRPLRPLADGAPHRLVLVEASSNSLIRTPEFVVQIASTWSARIHGLEGAMLRGEFHSETELPQFVPFAVFVDGRKVGEGEAVWDESSGRYPFAFAIPAAYFDGRPHVLGVATLGGTSAGEGSYVDVLRPVLTPWHHLVTRAEAFGHLHGSLPSEVARRLTTFQCRIRELGPEPAGADIANVLSALQALNTGYQPREGYASLRLPIVSDPDVSVIVPAHDKFELTYHCIASLILSANRCSCEVILVDDASTDATRNAEALIENLRVVRNEANLGFLRSCNAAAQAARGRFVVLLNNDTEVGNGWLDEMLAVFERFDHVGAVGAKLVYPNGRLQEAGGIIWSSGVAWNLGRTENPYDPAWNYVRQVDYLSGAAIMLPKPLWDSLGGLSDEFAPAYYEDTDLAFKVREAGYRTIYCPQAEVVHFEGMSHGRDTTEGIKRFQDVNAPKFCDKWSHAFAHNGRVGEDVWYHKDRNVRFRALVIDYTTPRPDRDAGSYAAIQEIRLLQSHGFKVTFVPEDLAHMGEYTRDLQKMGVECIHAPFHNSFLDLVGTRGREFDLVYVTRFDVAERHIDLVRQYTTAKVLFNNADLHFLRELRTQLARGAFDLSGPLATRERELALMHRVDGILTYNDAEQAVITSHNLRSDNVFKCPWVLPVRGLRAPFAERSGIAFLGGFGHPPNLQAVEYFVREVMPLLRVQSPGIRFHVFGSNQPAELERLATDDVVIEGYVRSLDDIFEKCRVFVAPLLSGAGIKGKVLDAMSYGVPSVLSPIAAESTGLIHGVSTWIAETPEEWASGIADLYRDEQRWLGLSTSALALAKSHYSFERGRKLMGRALASLGFHAGRNATFAVARFE